MYDQQKTSQTLHHLCRSATRRWDFEKESPARDVRCLFKTIDTPHMHKMVRFILIQRWRHRLEANQN